MIVVDTSSLVSLATADALHLVLDEYDCHTTETVIDELEATADHDDVSGTAARRVLERRGSLTVHEPADRPFQSSRIDAGEGSCCRLATDLEADFLITDDLRALPELQPLTAAEVAISPILLSALTKRGVLDRVDARERLDRIARNRDWLGTPIYRRAQRFFE